MVFPAAHRRLNPSSAGEQLPEILILRFPPRTHPRIALVIAAFVKSVVVILAVIRRSAPVLCAMWWPWIFRFASATCTSPANGRGVNALVLGYVDWRLGMALVLLENSRRAIDVLTANLRLDPFYPPLASGSLSFAHHMLKQYSDALPLRRDCVSRAPNLLVGHAWLAATHARLGRLEEARSEAAAVLRLQPNDTITGTAARFGAFKDAKDDKHLYDGLRKAGLPE